MHASRRLPLLLVIVAAPAFGEESGWFVHLGPITGVISQVDNGRAHGTVGAELTAGGVQFRKELWSLPISLGGFAQVEATQLDDRAAPRARVATGLQATIAVVGVEAGLGCELGAGENPTIPSAHLGVFLAGPIRLPTSYAFVSLGLRVEVPLGVSPSPGVALGPVVSIKFPFELNSVIFPW